VEQDPVGALLLCHPTPPRYVVVNGQVRVENGQIPGFDLQGLMQRHNRIVRELVGKSSGALV
jgi:hypothetical protein